MHDVPDNRNTAAPNDNDIVEHVDVFLYASQIAKFKRYGSLQYSYCISVIVYCSRVA